MVVGILFILLATEHCLDNPLLYYIIWTRCICLIVLIILNELEVSSDPIENLAPIKSQWLCLTGF